MIDALVSVDGKLILNDVYEFEDVQSLLSSAEQLFALLPNPGKQVLLADASPHLFKNAYQGHQQGRAQAPLRFAFRRRLRQTSTFIEENR